MPSKEVVDYIKKCRENNISDQDIKSRLIDSGWDKKIIEESFSSLDDNNAEDSKNKEDSITKKIKFDSLIRVASILFILVIIAGTAVSSTLFFRDYFSQEVTGEDYREKIEKAFRNTTEVRALDSFANISASANSGYENFEIDLSIDDKNDPRIDSRITTIEAFSSFGAVDKAFNYELKNVEGSRYMKVDGLNYDFLDFEDGTDWLESSIALNEESQLFNANPDELVDSFTEDLFSIWEEAWGRDAFQIEEEQELAGSSMIQTKYSFEVNKDELRSILRNKNFNLEDLINDFETPPFIDRDFSEYNLRFEVAISDDKIDGVNGEMEISSDSENYDDEDNRDVVINFESGFEGRDNLLQLSSPDEYIDSANIEDQIITTVESYMNNVFEFWKVDNLAKVDNRQAEAGVLRARKLIDQYYAEYEGEFRESEYWMSAVDSLPHCLLEDNMYTFNENENDYAFWVQFCDSDIYYCVDSTGTESHFSQNIDEDAYSCSESFEESVDDFDERLPVTGNSQIKASLFNLRSGFERQQYGHNNYSGFENSDEFMAIEGELPECSAELLPDDDLVNQGAYQVRSGDSFYVAWAPLCNDDNVYYCVDRETEEYYENSPTNIEGRTCTQTFE